MNFEKTLILIPTYNERQNIAVLLRALFDIYPKIHVWVIDDSSPDGTAEEVQTLMKIFPDLTLLSRSKKDGIGGAYKHAFKKLQRRNDIENIITMDADGSHDVSYIKDFVSAAEKYDLVVGSRYIPQGTIPQWELWRKALSSFGNIYARSLTGLRIKDLTSGFICVKADLIKKINFDAITSSGYSYQIEFKYICSQYTSKIIEMPITFYERKSGASKMSFFIIKEGIKTPLKIFLKKISRT